MRRLTKRDAERLLATYDGDPAGALARALATLLGEPGLGFDTAIDRLDLDGNRRAALLAGRTDALDALARQLNEDRTVPVR